jgi:DNA polymerase-4
VVLSANYAARRYGVRSAMPGALARRLCPQLVVVMPESGAVSRVATAVRDIFRRVTPAVEVMSVDEAFLDVSGSVRLLGPPVAIAESIRAQIRDELRITCSVGVAASRSVAKLASRRAKPDGVVVVRPHEVLGFLHPLDVGELYGVGPRTRARLHRLGLVTVADVAATPLPRLCELVGDGLAQRLQRLARGQDNTRVTPRRDDGESERSMGAQETFGRDVDDREYVVRELLRLTTKVTGRMRKAGVVGRTVTITVRFADFETITRSRTIPQPTDVTRQVHRTAVRLYDALGLHHRRLRLVGVRVEGLIERTRVERQGVLGEREHGWTDADRAVDLAVERFGRHAVRPASLLR